MSKKNIPTPARKTATVKNVAFKSYQFVQGYWEKYWQQIALLFALGIALYIYSITFDYVLDDQIVITKNEYTKKGLSGIWNILSTESMQGYFGVQKNLVVGGRYRPLSIVTFAMEYSVWGLNPFMSHLVNVVLYALTGLLLFRVLLLIFPVKDEESKFFNIPFIASLLFIAHPIHSEVVANVKGRDEILTLMGALASIYYTFKYLGDRQTKWLIASGFMFFLGLLGKENAITFLAIIPLTMYIAHRPSASDYTKALIPPLIATFVYLLIRRGVIGYFLSSGEKVTDLMNNPFVEMDYLGKMATIFYTLIKYIQLQIFPHPLTHDYYPYAVPKVTWTSIWAISSLLLHVGMGVFAIRNLKTKSILAYAILFYLITISIVSNIFFPVGTFMNERFVFVSSMGFCIAVGWFLTKWLPTKNSIAAFALFGILFIGYSAKTFERVPAWKNKLSLNTAAIKYSYNSARANCFMATALFEQFQVEKDPVKKKLMLVDINKYIKRSLEIYPDYYSAMQMNAGVLAANFAEDKDLDKLLAGFKEILKRRTTITYIDQYLEYLEKTPSIDPMKMRAFYFDLSYNVFYKQKKYYQNAAKYMDKVLKYDELDAKANFVMFKIMNDAGLFDQADKYRITAAAIDPTVDQYFK